MIISAEKSTIFCDKYTVILNFLIYQNIWPSLFKLLQLLGFRSSRLDIVRVFFTKSGKIMKTYYLWWYTNWNVFSSKFYIIFCHYCSACGPRISYFCNFRVSWAELNGKRFGLKGSLVDFYNGEIGCTTPKGFYSPSTKK